jgi:Domain of unknown function (DUF4129)
VNFEDKPQVVLMLRSKLQKRNGKWWECARIFAGALMTVALALGIFVGVARAANFAVDDVAAKQSVTLAQYEDDLNRITTAFSDLAAHPEGTDALRQSLPSGWTVDTGQEKFEVSAEWMKEPFAAKWKTADDRKKIWTNAAARVKTMREEAERLKDAAALGDRADATARLKKILSRREFNQAKGGDSWWSQMWDQVERWINWLLGHTLGRLLGNGAAKTVAIYVLIGAVFLFAAVWIVRGLRGMVRTETLSVDAAFPPGKHWRDWTREATAAASRGDYRAALHSAYWAGVYRLAELGAWKLDRARTPREYLRMIGEEGQNELAEQNPVGRELALKDLTHGMEASWYGFLPATQQDYDKAVAHLETLGCRFHSTAQTAKS